MKAVLCTSFGSIDNLIIENIPDLIPANDEVIINVKACGLNFPDTLIVQGKYQFKSDFPFSPGGEVSGIVMAIGDNVTNVKVGDKVMYGSVFGGFAEQVKAKAKDVFKMPPTMDFTTAASSMLTYGTSYHALVNRANLQSGETLLVLGAAGGVGTAAIQIAKALGAIVIAAASTDEKLEFCKDNGADYTVNYTTEDIKSKIKEITNGKGVNVIYDPVGDKFSEPALRSIAWKGRYLVVGFAAGDIPKIPLNLVLLKGCQIMGVFWGAFFKNEPQQNAENFTAIVKWFAQGKLKSRIHKEFPLERVVEAMHAMINKEVKGKIILIP
ncbi:MAG: NADPH:quinone oxidoreductase family protein [Chlorobi bacterium]|nr:NADPH:quinone oxidoreductase family protein [Chlorobiota bacterium]